MLQLAEMQLRKLDREYNRALAGVVAPGEGPQAPAGFVEFVGDGDGDGEGDTGSEEEDVDAGYSYFEPQGAAGAEDAGVRPVSPIAEDTKAAIARVMARVVMPDMPVPRLAQAILGSMGTPSSAPATAAVPVAAPAVPPAVDFDSMPSPFEGHIPSQAASTASTEAAVPAAPPHPPATADAAAASATGSEEPALPTVVIIVGMAGSGKTTLMQVTMSFCRNMSVLLVKGVVLAPFRAARERGDAHAQRARLHPQPGSRRGPHALRAQH